MTSIIQQKWSAGTLKAWYQFDQGTTDDLTGTYTGTITGTPFFSREGMNFDGTNDYVTGPNLVIEDNLTMICAGTPFSLDHAGGGNFPRFADRTGSYGMYVVQSSGLITFFTNGVSDSSTVNTTALEPFQNFVAAGTFDSSAGVRKVYLNGVLEGKEAGLTGNIDAGSADLAIGDNNTHVRKWNGVINTVMIFEETLTDLEVAQVTSELLNKTY